MCRWFDSSSGQKTKSQTPFGIFFCQKKRQLNLAFLWKRNESGRRFDETDLAALLIRKNRVRTGTGTGTKENSSFKNCINESQSMGYITFPIICGSVILGATTFLSARRKKLPFYLCAIFFLVGGIMGACAVFLQMKWYY